MPSTCSGARAFAAKVQETTCTPGHLCRKYPKTSFVKFGRALESFWLMVSSIVFARSCLQLDGPTQAGIDLHQYVPCGCQLCRRLRKKPGLVMLRKASQQQIPLSLSRGLHKAARPIALIRRWPPGGRSERFLRLRDLLQSSLPYCLGHQPFVSTARHRQARRGVVLQSAPELESKRRSMFQGSGFGSDNKWPRNCLQCSPHLQQASGQATGISQKTYQQLAAGAFGEPRSSAVVCFGVVSSTDASMSMGPAARRGTVASPIACYGLGPPLHERENEKKKKALVPATGWGWRSVVLPLKRSSHDAIASNDVGRAGWHTRRLTC